MFNRKEWKRLREENAALRQQIKQLTEESELIKKHQRRTYDFVSGFSWRLLNAIEQNNLDYLKDEHLQEQIKQLKKTWEDYIAEFKEKPPANIEIAHLEVLLSNVHFLDLFLNHKCPAGRAIRAAYARPSFQPYEPAECVKVTNPLHIDEFSY